MHRQLFREYIRGWVVGSVNITRQLSGHRQLFWGFFTGWVVEAISWQVPGQLLMELIRGWEVVGVTRQFPGLRQQLLKFTMRWVVVGAVSGQVPGHTQLLMECRGGWWDLSMDSFLATGSCSRSSSWGGW